MSSHSSDSIRNRSNSVDDTELPTHDRKRPRLSTNELCDNTRSIASSSLKLSSPSASRQLSPTGTQSKSMIPIVSAPTSSKVTINTRPLSAQSMGETGHLVVDEDAIDPALIQPINQVNGNREHNGDAVDSAEQTRSPSPTIEVAELEDFDTDPTQTRWTTQIGGSPSLRTIDSLHLRQNFPWAQPFAMGEAYKALGQIHRHLYRSQEDGGPVFREIALWMIGFVEECDHIPTELMERERLFWTQLPELFSGLWQFNLAPLQSLPINESVATIAAYGRLTKLIIEYDLLQLRQSQTSNDEVCTLTSAYLAPLSHIIRSCTTHSDVGENQFLARLKRCRSEDVSESLETATRALLDRQKIGLLSTLSTYATALSANLQKHPALSGELVSIADATLLATQTFSPVILPEQFCVLKQHETEKLEAMQSAESIARTLDNLLQLAIKKQSPWLNLKTAQVLIFKIQYIMKGLAVEVPALAQSIITAATGAFEDEYLSSLQQVMPQAWVLLTLWMFIRHGRMELRVYGIDVMGTELVNCWRDRIGSNRNGNGQQDPLVRYIVNFLRFHDIINYVIGPDSHPQLTGRAGNLVGFLGVAGVYQNTDTDIMWKTISETPDPRIATEVLRTLQASLPAIAFEHIYHICEKLLELSFDRWNDDFFLFTCTVFNRLSNHALHPYYGEARPLEPVTRLLCIKIVRDCYLPGACGTEMSRKLLAEFGPHLATFLRASSYNSSSFGIAAEEESDIFSSLRSAIICNTDHAGGAVCSIYHILRGAELNPALVLRVAELCDLPSSLVLNIAHVTESFTHNSMIPGDFHHQLECRINLLGQLIASIPDRFDLASLELLWSALLANGNLDEHVRSESWEMLIERLLERRRNGVIDTILQHFWPLLPPEVISKATLRFAEEAINYEFRLNGPVRTSADGIITIPGLERIKQIMIKTTSGSVEVDATDTIINTYLRHPIMKQPRNVIHATHLALIDESVSMVLASASKLQSFGGGQEDATVAIIASQEDICQSELLFDRYLLLLRRFIEAIRTRPGSSPLHEDRLPDFPGLKGEHRDLAVEVCSGKHIAAGSRKIVVGIENTGSELWQYLSNVTGFSSFKVYHSGREILLEDVSSSLADLNVTAKVQVQKNAGTAEQEPRLRMRSISPADEKIMLHFDALFGLLDADDRLAKEIYELLSITTVRDQVGRELRGMTTPASDVLSLARPYKLLFTSQAMRAEVESEALAEAPNIDFIAYAVKALLSSCTKLVVASSENLLQFSVMEEVVETLLLALRVEVPVEFGKSYIDDHAAVSSCLLQHVINVARALDIYDTIRTFQSLRNGWEALLECTLHDDGVWHVLKSNENFAQILRLALYHHNAKVRRGFAATIASMTGYSSVSFVTKPDRRSMLNRYEASSVKDTLQHLWDLFQTIIEEVEDHSLRCQQFLDICAGVLKALDGRLSSKAITAFFSLCQKILVNHTHVETVGRPLQDRLIAGMVPVLDICAKFMRKQGILPQQTEFISHLLHERLFPILALDMVGPSTQPIVDPEVRSSIYGLMLTLCQQEDDITRLAHAVDGIADENAIKSSSSFDRLNLRSNVGYAGLVNLSNTCYLNSLLSQLFMNLDFRKFILEKSQSERVESELIFELARIFTQMSGSFDKDVTTSGLVESIVTYEGDKIDVTVQMDVDEFFNLLTDRIEGQISEQSIRNSFRSFYGGQVIQQIKSMECEHVSERPEPFYVVPVEIKGKNSLEESLQAYVEGEILQGDNKYHCTTCDRNVDAVKRSCFKQLPDHLIFNLKRFDYDILTYMRTKLNDRFEFPMSINMAPYTLEAVADGGCGSLEPDIFDLSGIIVHSGTAETGHYYSFIRERSSNGVDASWVQFNDSDVTEFDKNTIADCCFGGIDPSMMSMAKFYNAYMLFYTRRSNLQSMEQLYCTPGVSGPPRIPGPSEVEASMNKHNEHHLRSYVLQDPRHAFFVRDMLSVLDTMCNEKCSQEHECESATFRMALAYMAQVSTKWKQQPAVAETALQLRKRMKQCPICAALVVDWLTEDRARFVQAFVQNSYPLGRQELASLIINGLRGLRDSDSEARFEDDERSSRHQIYVSLVTQTTRVLSSMWYTMSKMRLSWTEYFWLVEQVSQLDSTSFNILLSSNILMRFLDLFELHIGDNQDAALRLKYSEYLNMREKRREFNYGAMVDCFFELIRKIDLELEPAETQRTYVQTKQRSGLSSIERHRLALDTGLPWLEKLILGNLVDKPILKLVQLFAEEPIAYPGLARMLQRGLKRKNMNVAVTFIDPSVTFLMHCGDEDIALTFARTCMHVIEKIDLDYALEFSGFVSKCARIRNATLGEGFLESLLSEMVAEWSPTLLMGNNENGIDVRQRAYNLVDAVFLVPLQQAATANASDLELWLETARALLIKIAKVASDNFWAPDGRSQSIEPDHFQYVIQVYERCCLYAFPEHDDETMQKSDEYNLVNACVARMAKQQSMAVVDLTSQNEYDASSDLEDLSDNDYETDGNQP